MHTINFGINFGQCTQQIEILDKSYSIDDIVQGLNNGDFLTSTWFDDDRENYVVCENGENIAKIVTSEIDGEYNDFELVD